MSAPAGRQVPSFRTAARYWARLGLVNFGGPAGQIALLHRDLVVRRRWISEERFLHALNFCMLLPGPEAQQLAIYIGWLLHGTRGGVVAGVLFVLPSVFVLLALSLLYTRYGALPAAIAVLSGIKPIVVAIVVAAFARIARRALRGGAPVALAAGAFLAISFLGVPFPAIVAAAALLGLAGARRPRAEDAAAGAVEASPESLAGRHRGARAPLRRILSTGIVLWVGPLLLLALTRGASSLHVREYLFFTQASLVTFGGAYAVLAYVTRAAVESFGWMTAAQAVDGLALAETTPGPLIMVLQFVGFLAAWNRPEGLPRPVSAAVGALVTTWATFLPSFLFIFLTAPFLERLRGERRLSAALAAVTAAAVGVIANLAFVLGRAVFVPGGSPDVPAVALSAAALLALLRLRIDVPWLVLAGGLAGLVRAASGI